MDEHTHLPCDKILSLTSNVKKGYLNAMVTCKRAFVNIMTLNLHGSLMNNEDQLALSVVSWPHLEHVNLSQSGIFDRPCALFLKKWLDTINVVKGPVIIDISSNTIDLLTLHYCCKWMNDTRLRFLRLISPSSTTYPLMYFTPYVEFINHCADNHCTFLAYRINLYRIVSMAMGLSENLMHSVMENITKDPGSYSSLFACKKMESLDNRDDAFRFDSLLSTCPMEQDWYANRRVKLVMKKNRTSGRSKNKCM